MRLFLRSLSHTIKFDGRKWLQFKFLDFLSDIFPFVFNFFFFKNRNVETVDFFYHLASFFITRQLASIDDLPHLHTFSSFFFRSDEDSSFFQERRSYKEKKSFPGNSSQAFVFDRRHEKKDQKNEFNEISFQKMRFHRSDIQMD